MDALNVGEVMSGLSDFSDKAAKASSNIADLLARQAAISESAANQEEANAQDASLTAKVSGAGLLAAQDATSETANLLQSNSFDPNGLKRQSLEEFVMRQREAADKLKVIKEKSSVSFFDNPMEYIMNQLDLPQLTHDYNLTAVQANSAIRTVNEIDSTLTNEAAANKAIHSIKYTVCIFGRNCCYA